MQKYILSTISFLLILSSNLTADLVWTKDEGWKAEGGLAKRFFGEMVTARNGLDAMNKAKIEEEKGNDSGALKLYKKVYTEYKTSVLAPEALYQSGLIYKKRHQFSDAFKLLQQIITNYPDYPKFNQVIDEQFAVAALLQKGKRPYYWGIIPGFRDYGAAVNYFESIIKNAPFTKYAPMALMNLGMLAKERNKPEDAIDALDRLINDYPKSDLAPEAYVLLGDTYASLVRGPAYDQGYTKEAIATYEDFLILYPSNERVKDVEEKLLKMRDIEAKNRLLMGDFYYLYRNNPKAALVFYNETITVHPQSDCAKKAQEQIDLIHKGVPAPKTIVDSIFGRYEEPSEPAYLDQAEIELDHTRDFMAKQNKEFLPKQMQQSLADDEESAKEKSEEVKEPTALPAHSTDTENLPAASSSVDQQAPSHTKTAVPADASVDEKDESIHSDEDPFTNLKNETPNTTKMNKSGPVL